MLAWARESHQEGQDEAQVRAATEAVEAGAQVATSGPVPSMAAAGTEAVGTAPRTGRRVFGSVHPCRACVARSWLMEPGAAGRNAR